MTGITAFRKALYISILLILMIGCDRPVKDDRLLKINELAATDAKSAVAALRSVDSASLRGADRHFYDLLRVKTADKAYIVHTSDSLILDVIDYYASHPKDSLYAEALYYGGRVYSDLGDYPTSLSYFQKALDRLPPETDNKRLRSTVLSQTGRLLNKLRLYDEAIPYIKESSAMSRLLGDTIGEMYDLQLLGSVYLRAKKYNEAERYFNEAFSKTDVSSTADRAKSLMYLAMVKYRIGRMDSALSLICDIPNAVSAKARNTALACAAEIYYEAGIEDTAYMYARELIHNDDPLNKATGYQIILSPELRDRIQTDTLCQYFSDYLPLLESYLNDNENQLALNQQNSYNYALHERERAKAEKSNKLLILCIVGICFVSFVLAILFLVFKIRNKNNLIALHAALANIERLEKVINYSPEDKHGEECHPSDDKEEKRLLTLIDKKETVEELREKLLSKINELSKLRQTTAIDSRIIRSEPYLKLQTYLSNDMNLKEKDSLWKDLETEILKCSPNFFINLQLLVGGKLSSFDKHTSILIKCGISTSQMSKLLMLSSSAIVSRRNSICIRAFGEKLGPKNIDHIIRSL